MYVEYYFNADVVCLTDELLVGLNRHLSQHNLQLIEIDNTICRQMKA